MPTKIRFLINSIKDSNLKFPQAFVSRQLGDIWGNLLISA